MEDKGERRERVRGEGGSEKRREKRIKECIYEGERRGEGEREKAWCIKEQKGESDRMKSEGTTKKKRKKNLPNSSSMA